MELVSNSEDQTGKIAAEIAKKIRPGQIIFLEGDLGVGKTLFTKAFLNQLGFSPQAVKSPTYTYVRHYQFEHHNIYHLDLYRIAEFDLLLEQEIQELAGNSNNILIIEWADRLKNGSIKIEPNIRVKFEHLSANQRKIKIEHNE